MRIIVDKLSARCDLDNERMVVDIPDDQLLRLGKKYFELASKGEKEENPYYLTDEDMMVCARKLKTFCMDQGNCKGCPFVIEDAGPLYGCKIGCRTDEKFYTPDNWEV